MTVLDIKFLAFIGTLILILGIVTMGVGLSNVFATPEPPTIEELLMTLAGLVNMLLGLFMVFTEIKV